MALEFKCKSAFGTLTAQGPCRAGFFKRRLVLRIPFKDFIFMLLEQEEPEEGQVQGLK